MRREIKGHGKKDGMDISVTVIMDNGRYAVSAMTPYYQNELLRILKKDVVVGGTYITPNGSLLKAYYAIDEFFDRKWTCDKIIGKMEKIPYKPGVIY